MEVFSPFIGSHDDFKELWETDLDPTMQEVLRLNSSSEDSWSYMEKHVVIHDRLMTDAALGTRPIKSEHSYSLASNGDTVPDSPTNKKIDDIVEMEEDCFPTIACERLSDRAISIKDEPLSESESPHSSCPSSPQSSFMNTSELHFDIDVKSEEDKPIVKQTSIMITSPHSIIPQRNLQHIQKLNIKLEPINGFNLPPTPPSCSSSSSEDSEDNTTISQPPSPNIRKTNISTTAKVIMNHTTTRQPIHTPLISSQPKGSTGTLMLTEEEKRTLIAEGYPVPTRLPLTKAEEKSLKKIRRKIKNKISAQESRRKKKEYMDQLEKKVEILVNENNNYRSKIESLEDSNNNLLSQLQKLQAIVARTHPQLIKQLK